MKDISIEVMSFADLYAIHQYVKDKIETIKEDHPLDPDEPTVGFNPANEEGRLSVTMVPEIGGWEEILDKVEQEIEDRLEELFDL